MEMDGPLSLSLSPSKGERVRATSSQFDRDLE
jgi:hypothetical protein